MELYFYEDCEYSQIVINTIANLEIREKFIFKDIRGAVTRFQSKGNPFWR